MIEINEMMTIKDFENINLIFSKIREMSNIFYYDDVVITNLFLVRYSDKIVNPSLVNLSPEQLAELIILEYSEKWKILTTDLFWKDFNIGAKQITMLTETIDKTEKRNVDKDDLNKVSGFDSDMLIVDNGLNSKTKDDLTGKEEKVTTNQIINMETAFNNLSLAMKNTIIETVLNDVKNFTTLGIY